MKTPAIPEGKTSARWADYLDRLHAGVGQPDELAVIVANLRGEMPRWFCRLLQKAMERMRNG